MKHIHSNNHPGVLDERGARRSPFVQAGWAWRGNMAPLASGSGKLATHDDVVDGNVDELHEKANEAHNQEPGGGARGTRQAQ